jgi:hypothetical protein
VKSCFCWNGVRLDEEDTVEGIKLHLHPPCRREITRKGRRGQCDRLRRYDIRQHRYDPDATERALLAGFLLGDTRAVPDDLVDDFRDSGLSHLLAVSGANVAFVLAIAMPASRLYFGVHYLSDVLAGALLQTLRMPVVLVVAHLDEAADAVEELLDLGRAPAVSL